MLQRIIKGDPRHRTRLHDFEGIRAPLVEVLRLPHSIASTVLLRCGYRERLPWLSFRVIKRLKQLIRPDFKVLEFGSGSSTVWIAKRCSLLVTIENDPEWYEWVKTRIGKNVDARLRDEGSYCTVEGYPDHSFDLVIVDGRWRNKAMLKALRAVKPGGYIYFDNSDVQDSEHQEARRLLLTAYPNAERLIGLIPFQVSVCQGLLARV